MGGGALSYYGAHRFAQDDDLKSGGQWVALDAAGTFTMEVGGALATLWGWRLGEHDFQVDRASGGPIKDRRSLAVTGLVVGGAAVVGMTVGFGYVYSKYMSCLGSSNGVSGAELRQCTGDYFVKLSVVDLVADGVLMFAAPLAGYGFGYESAARRAGASPAGFDWRLTPLYLQSGAGLGFSGRF